MTVDDQIKDILEAHFPLFSFILSMSSSSMKTAAKFVPR